MSVGGKSADLWVWKTGGGVGDVSVTKILWLCVALSHMGLAFCLRHRKHGFLLLNFHTNACLGALNGIMHWNRLNWHEKRGTLNSRKQVLDNGIWKFY